MNELDLLEVKEAEEFDKQESWKINDINTASWALKKISSLNKLKSQNDMLVKEEMEKLRKWQDSKNGSIDASIEFFENKLGEFYQSESNGDVKYKIETPNGYVSTRKTPQKFNYLDSAIDELKSAGLSEFVRVKEEVNKKDLKKNLMVTEDFKVVSPNGEILTGVVVVPESYNLVIKPE